jgi:hypothetical protein
MTPLVLRIPAIIPRVGDSLSDKRRNQERRGEHSSPAVHTVSSRIDRSGSISLLPVPGMFAPTSPLEGPSSVGFASTLTLLAAGPSRPLLRGKRPKRRCGGHAQSDSSIPVHSARAALFRTRPLRSPFNPLNYRAFKIRTKMVVVRLLRRKWAERDEKRPDGGPQAGPHGSNNWPGMAAFCRVPSADLERKKNVPTGRLGGGRGTVVQPSLCEISKA